MSRVYEPENLPTGISWLYDLNTEDLQLQCEVLGIPTTSSASRINRPLLSRFLKSLTINGGTIPIPVNHRPEMDLQNRPVGTLPPDPFEDLTLDYLLTGNGKLEAPPPPPPVSSATVNLSPASSHYTPLTTAGTPTSSAVSRVSIPVTATTTTVAPSTPFLGVRHFSSVFTQTSPIPQPNYPQLPLQNPSSSAVPLGQQPAPGWQDIIQATAVAVATQVATTMAQCQQSIPPPTSQTPPHILSSLLSNLPTTSGSDSGVLVHFLTSVGKFADMGLTTPHNLIVGCLPQTTGQLRSLWSQAISDRTPLDVLIKDILDFFIPGQLRHSLVAKMVYRAQKDSEPLPEFVESIQECAVLLAPHLSDSDLLEVAVNGLNAATRANLAVFPSPASLSDLLSLVPRLQVVHNLHGRVPSPALSHPARSSQPPTPTPSQPAFHPNPRHPSPSQDQPQPRNNSFRHSFRYPNHQNHYRPFVPRFPFGNQHSAPSTPRPSSHQPRSFYSTPQAPGQLNRRGGRL